MKAELTRQNAFLQKLVGVWDVTSAPGENGSDYAVWTEIVRSLNGRWVVAEGEGKMPGGQMAETLMTLGYDQEKGKFIGTWIGSMMDHMWVYEGFLDKLGRTLMLDTTGPDLENKGRIATYREAITIINENERVFTSTVRQADGNWKALMVAKYHRKL